MQTLINSCSDDDTRFNDLTTISSLKSSLTSLLRSSINQSKFFYTGTLSEIKSEELSINTDYEDIDEDCSKKTIGNFHKNYLKLGQWPEIQTPVYQRFKQKYKNLKQKLIKTKEEKEKLEGSLRRFVILNNKSCKNCEVLKGKHEKTKSALEEAMELSKLLMLKIKNAEMGREGE